MSTSRRTSRFRFTAAPLLLAAALAACFLYSCNDTPPDASSGSQPPAMAPAGAPDGQRLFVENCAACHQRDRDATGPALKGVLARWDGDIGRLRAFIRNNKKATEAGDPRAQELQQKWDAAMPLYPDFTDRDLDAILTYIEAD